MSPEKTARNSLCCDKCLGIVPKGGKYRVDGSGYLLCPACAAYGDMKLKEVCQ